MVDLDEYRATSRASWAQVAPGWERRREWLMDATGTVNDWLVRRADPQPGQTYLELAGGTGDLSFLVADRVGTSRVIYSDFAEEMVHVARRHGEARGVGNVEYRVVDAERMELGDNSVDGVVCRFGYMLMADPAAALRHTRRVLRDGGPLAFAVWATPDRNPWAAVPAMTLVQRGHLPPPEPGGPGMFAMAMPERIRELVAGAGFEEPEIEEIAFEFPYADGGEVWDALMSLSASISRVVKALPEEEREASREAILQNVESYRNEDGSYTPPAAAWGVLAR